MPEGEDDSNTKTDDSDDSKVYRKKETERSDTIDSTTARLAFSLSEDKKNVKNNTHCLPCTNRARIRKWVELAILVCMCIAVTSGFMVPIIIYAVDAGRGNNNATISLELDLNSCSVNMQGSTVNTSVLSLYDDNCTEYNGVCTQYLSQLGNETDETSLLHTLTLRGISEVDIVSFMDALNQFSTFVNPDCRDAVLPFLCQYFFPTCTGSEDVLFISQEQCSDIRDVTCSVEWRLINGMPSLSHLLPSCENFADINNSSSVIPDIENSSTVVPQSLQCHYQFKEFCGLCLPLCGRFSQYRVKTKFLERGIIIFAGITAFIGGVLVFIAVAYRWKAMLDFPAVLVMYNTICTFVIACLVLITYIGGQERLYCSHEALNVAVDNPSAFCKFSGFMYHWTLVLLAMLWLLHLIHLFIKIMFPMWSRKLNRKQTKIILHVTEVTGAVFLSIIAPVVAISRSEYSIVRFPPLLCFPSSEVSFYSVCLPLCLILGTGVILAIIMFWTLHKRQPLFNKKASSHFWTISFSVPEVKVLILSCYFVVFGIISLVNLSISIRDADITLNKLLGYLTCQARGYSVNNTCSAEYREFDKHLKPELNTATYFLLGLVPWSNLLFAIQFLDLKKVAKRLLYARRRLDMTERTLSTSQDRTFSTSQSRTLSLSKDRTLSTGAW